jgi:hypothetical protein
MRISIRSIGEQRTDLWGSRIDELQASGGAYSFGATDATNTQGSRTLQVTDSSKKLGHEEIRKALRGNDVGR